MVSVHQSVPAHWVRVRTGLPVYDPITARSALFPKVQCLFLVWPFAPPVLEGPDQRIVSSHARSRRRRCRKTSWNVKGLKSRYTTDFKKGSVETSGAGDSLLPEINGARCNSNTSMKNSDESEIEQSQRFRAGIDNALTGKIVELETSQHRSGGMKAFGRAIEEALG